MFVVIAWLWQSHAKHAMFITMMRIISYFAVVLYELDVQCFELVLQAHF